MFELMVQPSSGGPDGSVDVTWRQVHLDLREQELSWSAARPLTYG